MTTVTRKLFLAGRWEESEDQRTVRNPYTGEAVANVATAGTAMVVEASTAAVAGFQSMRRLAAYARAEILQQASEGIADRRAEFATTITKENGKPLKLAKLEVERAVHTFRAAAGEATRLHGELIPLDLRRGLEGRFGLVRRVPIGPVLGISPFNFPLNLVAHKVAPALAVGCSIVVKPASRTPLSALLLAEVLEAAGLPPGGLTVLPCDRLVGDLLVQNEAFRALSFTGSADVGFALKARAAKKPAVLELGGNAAAIVHRDADIDRAVRQCVAGAFAFAGQVCISIQRIFVHDEIADEFTRRFLAATDGQVLGDPMDPETDVGPMISEEEAERVERWIEEAQARGARVLTGGRRDGAMMQPTVLTDVDPTLPIDCQEVFGPVVNLHRYQNVAAAIDAVNESRYGLQAGVFTRDLGLAIKAFDELEVGGVILNDAPTFRVDTMPYGGTKDSGLGREGVPYAVEHFTERKLLAIEPPESG